MYTLILSIVAYPGYHVYHVPGFDSHEAAKQAGDLWVQSTGLISSSAKFVVVPMSLTAYGSTDAKA